MAGKKYALNSKPSNDESRRGIGGDALDEPTPDFLLREGDEKLKGDNNTWIILGRDRPGDRLSGYGGKGNHGAGTIDIVAGRMAPIPLCNFPGGNEEKLELDNMFGTHDAPELSGYELENGATHPGTIMDAARIYISQMTDVDHNFNLITGGTNGSPGEEESPRSAIAMKADELRFIARQGVKIVTGGRHEGRYGEPVNSQGGTLSATYGIDLIAGNGFPNYGDEYIQQEPLLKGDKTIAALDDIADSLDKICGALLNFVKIQQKFNIWAGNHTHPEIVLLGIPGSPDPLMSLVETPINILENMATVVTSIAANKFNTTRFWGTYLNPLSDDYICSRWNTTN